MAFCLILQSRQSEFELKNINLGNIKRMRKFKNMQLMQRR
jgi:hypothetical protein